MKDDSTNDEETGSYEVEGDPEDVYAGGNEGSGGHCRVKSELYCDQW